MVTLPLPKEEGEIGMLLKLIRRIMKRKRIVRFVQNDLLRLQEMRDLLTKLHEEPLYYGY